jgi:hypothetical protein
MTRAGAATDSGRSFADDPERMQALIGQQLARGSHPDHSARPLCPEVL